MKDRTLCTSRSSVVGGACVAKYLSAENVVVVVVVSIAVEALLGIVCSGVPLSISEESVPTYILLTVKMVDDFRRVKCASISIWTC